MRTANAVAIAGGTVAAALLDVLIEKGILTEGDAMAVCLTAQTELVPYTGNGGDAVEAARIIGEVYSRLAKSGAQPTI